MLCPIHLFSAGVFDEPETMVESQLFRQGASALWYLGRRLHIVHDQHLWCGHLLENRLGCGEEKCSLETFLLDKGRRSQRLANLTHCSKTRLFKLWHSEFHNYHFLYLCIAHIVHFCTIPVRGSPLQTKLDLQVTLKFGSEHHGRGIAKHKKYRLQSGLEEFTWSM